MVYTQITEQVRKRARISHDEAVQAISATLQTLAERLGGVESRRMASQLPVQLKKLLAGPREPRRYSLEEFFNRVAGRADIGRGEAVKRSTITMQVISEAMSRNQMADVFGKLPIEYDELLHV